MRKILALLLVFTATSFAGDNKLSVDYKRYVLENGLNVILHEDHTTPTISVNVLYFVGSGHEKKGRTGFAHLFEHLMWEGSLNVPEGKFDEWLEAAGGVNNGSTNIDRTNYWDNIPSNALELTLFLESDRMGYLADNMSPDIVDGQRDVVKNERRQSYENRPYGMAWITLIENIYEEDHPYSWPTIGYMEDLTAASFQDVVDFYDRYYVPNNASLAIAGDIDTDETIKLVEKWFSEIPAGDPVPPIEHPEAYLTEERRVVLEDNVQLPRFYVEWLTPTHFTPGDAELDVLSDILSNGKNSRLYKRLVYDLQIAQNVVSFQYSGNLSSRFILYVTARSGHTLKEIEKVVREEINLIKSEPPTMRELERSVNQREASFLSQLELIGGFGGKAATMNLYYYKTGNPDYFNEDLSRYKSLSPSDIQTAAITHLKDDAKVILSIVPKGKLELAAGSKDGGK